MFESSSGLKVNILIGLNNTFKDAVMVYIKYLEEYDKKKEMVSKGVDVSRVKNEQGMA